MHWPTCWPKLSQGTHLDLIGSPKDEGKGDEDYPAFSEGVRRLAGRRCGRASELPMPSFITNFRPTHHRLPTGRAGCPTHRALCDEWGLRKVTPNNEAVSAPKRI